MANGLRSDLPASLPGCKVALLPVENLVGGMSWDTSRPGPMFQIGTQINHYCVEAMGLSVGGTGGVDRVGEFIACSVCVVR